MHYANRTDAGLELATSLAHLRGTDVIVLGLPRGGVPVARAVADALDAPLDVILVRKIGVPGQPELAMGALGEGDARVVNDDVVRLARVTDTAFDMVEARERKELARRARVLREGRDRIALAGRTVVIVDDGMATGATAAVACQVARAAGAARVILAVPVAAPEAVGRLRVLADEVVCPYTPHTLGSVGGAYYDFHQLDDAEVMKLLAGD